MGNGKSARQVSAVSIFLAILFWLALGKTLLYRNDAVALSELIVVFFLTAVTTDQLPRPVAGYEKLALLALKWSSGAMTLVLSILMVMKNIKG